MKEYDDNDNLIIDNDNENAAVEEQKKDKTIRTIYENLSDIPSRVKFFVDCKKHIEASKLLNRANEGEEQELAALLEEFSERYIKNGNEGIINEIFETIGNIKAESDYRAYIEYDNYLDRLEDEEELKEEKSMWALDNTGSGIDKTAVNKIMSDLMSAYENNVEDKVWNKKKVNDSVILKYYDSIKLSEKAKGDIIQFSTEFDKSDSEREHSYAEIEEWRKADGKKLIRAKRAQDLETKNNSYESFYKEGKKPDTLDHDDFVRDMVRTYNSLKTMKEKLEFIVLCNTDTTAKNCVYGNNTVPYKETDVKGMLLVDFIDTYVKEEDYKAHKQVIMALGEIKAKNSIKLGKESEKYRSQYEAEGDKGIRKADYITTSTLPGLCAAGVLKTIYDNVIESVKNTVDINDYEPVIDANLSEETTRREYFRMIGFSEEEIQKRLELSNKSGDEPAYYDFMNDDINDVDTAIMALKDDYMNKHIVVLVEAGADKVYNNAGINKEYIKELKMLERNHETEPNTHGIKDWIEKEGDALCELKSFEAGQVFLNDYAKKFDKSVGYEQYMRLHTGYDIINADSIEQHYKDNLLMPNPGNYSVGQIRQNDYLAKAIACDLLKNSAEKFSVKTIHKVADGIKKIPDFMQIIKDRNVVKKALISPEHITEIKNILFVPTYSVKADKVEEYINRMDTLCKNMMTSKGRSDKYKYFHNVVNQISKLKNKYDFSNEKDKKAAAKTVSELNLNLMNGIEVYIKDKQKVRTFDDGKERFNNAMDAVAILSECGTHIAPKVIDIVSKINEARDVKPGSSKYLDIKKYGDKRAAAAKLARNNAEKKVAPLNNNMVK